MNAPHSLQHNLPHLSAAQELAAALRWCARLNMHESVANHFSLAVNDDGTQFLMNPNQVHFSRVKASDLLLLDANDAGALDQPNAPDPSAWGLHSALHRNCAHARCAMHVHSDYATVLASLADSNLPAIDQNSAMFFNRYVIDEDFGGMVTGDEGARCVSKLTNPRHFVLIMGNHGVMVVGETVAQTFNRLYYFERAAKTYIMALHTGRPLRVLSDEIAEKTAQEWEDYPGLATQHLAELMAILDAEGSDYAR